MSINFQITAIEASKFQHLFDLNQQELQKIGAVKQIVDQYPGYPCRVSLEDATVGEEVILFPYAHHQVTSPYQSSGPIFIRKNVATANLKPNEIPKMLKHRLLSLRIYNGEGMMIDAKTVQGKGISDTLIEVFQNGNASYIQVHNSGPGCFNCQVNRINF